MGSEGLKWPVESPSICPFFFLGFPGDEGWEGGKSYDLVACNKPSCLFPKPKAHSGFPMCKSLLSLSWAKCVCSFITHRCKAEQCQVHQDNPPHISPGRPAACRTLLGESGPSCSSDIDTLTTYSPPPSLNTHTQTQANPGPAAPCTHPEAFCFFTYVDNSGELHCPGNERKQTDHSHHTEILLLLSFSLVLLPIQPSA